jgi:3-methylcrotonyl-CoA carboxylase alpha subunit
LIANRGEIACRVMRTAKKLGIQTVAIYSEADKNSMHVQLADEAYCVGPAESSKSYLRWEKIIEIAKNSKAKAIHPGYGFLSENSDFADQVQQHGLEFIGPPSQSIVDMGSKSASKNIMIAAGVPVVPGYHGSNQDSTFLKQKSEEMGFPVLIKAVKGGGGKGMRIVYSSEEFLENLESSRREAIKHFSDDKVLVEKYIIKPRHVEVQVFADKLGNAVYLFERDCSVQRRHQKILEEAPGPNISEELRKSLGEKAVAAAKAVNYVGAGTVEFILDTDTNEFYFMEMNTRLQVEHPITEMITNTDLVEWQLRVAAGNRLPKLQDELKLRGHSFEARIYAENPERGFLPDTGKLVHMQTPEPSIDVRIETGVKEGDEVSVHYDPMISKLVVWSENRTEALRVLRKALGEFEVVGPATNIEFLKSLASHPSFIQGDVDTGFINRHEAKLFPPKPMLDASIVGTTVLYLIGKDRLNEFSSDPWVATNGFRLNTHLQRSFTLFQDEERKQPIQVSVTFKSDRFDIMVTYPDQSVQEFHDCILHSNDAKKVQATIGNSRISSRIISHKESLHIFSNGKKYQVFTPLSSFDGESDVHGDGSLLAPMPCKISHVHVKAGDKVKKGQTILVLEAMKMEV